MRLQPTETLDFLVPQGFAAIELAGFFSRPPAQLKRQLDNRGLKIYSIHGPTLKPGPDSTFYSKWARTHLLPFNCSRLGIEASPAFLQDKHGPDLESAYGQLVQLLVQIANDLKPDGIRVSYHCFSEDFAEVEGRPLVARLFDRCPDNLGLQLDTFWLHHAGVDLSSLLPFPIDSVHLNERDDNGDCCVLGNDPPKCLDYVQRLAATGRPIDWILENDPADEHVESLEPPQLANIEDCVAAWPRIWSAAVASDEPSVARPCNTPTPAPRMAGAARVGRHSERDPSGVYSYEVTKALGENLLGDERFLRPLAYDIPQVQYYVTKRQNRSGDTERLLAERDMFALFWPIASAAQVIHVVGGAGSGKSTFLRYFFQYYLPHRERILGPQGRSSSMNGIYAESVGRQVVLYVDLRGPDVQQFRSWIFRKLSDSLRLAAQTVGFSLSEARNSSGPEDWFRQNLYHLARQVDGKNRKWYVSILFDNSDQMDEDSQLALARLVREYVRDEPPDEWPTEPVLDEKDALWRVIVPIRPETKMNLESVLAPFANRRSYVLEPIDQDELVSKRADFLAHTVASSDRHLDQDVWLGDARPRFDLTTPEEVAEAFRAALLAAGRLGGPPAVISEEARTVLDLLVNNSARQRLRVLERATLSRSFRERYRQGIRKGWRIPVSDFYLFDGLIRGNSSVFDPEADGCPILNLYNLGHEPGSPRSMFVGLHAIYLLHKSQPWLEVRETLKRLGYDDDDVDACEHWLERREIIKPLRNGRYLVEDSVARGHWALLKERAYTDNLAVSCAKAWRVDGQPASGTDPLDPADLPSRFKCSLWFMKRIWEAERVVATCPARSDYLAFATFFNSMRLPSIAHHVADEYLSKVSRLPQYVRPGAAIKAEEPQWDCARAELETLVKESSGFMKAQQHRTRPGH